MPNSPSWSRPLAPQPLDARELARRQAVRRPQVRQPPARRPDHDPPGRARTGDRASLVGDEFDDDLAEDDDLDGNDDNDENDDDEDDDDLPGPGGGGRHRAGLAPWRHEVRQRAADRLPPGVRALRWRVGRSAARGAALVAVVAVLALVIAAYLSWPRQGGDGPAAGQPVPPRTGVVAVTSPVGSAPGARATPGPLATGAAATSGTLPPPASPTAAVVVVHVAGQVAQPGLVTLPAGSRVAQALAAAGGASGTADLDRVNLARPLVDGEQVLVPAPGEAVPPVAVAAAPASAGAATAGPLDLNAATEQDLDGLPGVGEVLAGRILAWRTEHTRFSDVEELGEVQGIGPKLLAGLRPLVRV